jgi:hypothetical protein
MINDASAPPSFPGRCRPQSKHRAEVPDMLFEHMCICSGASSSRANPRLFLSEGGERGTTVPPDLHTIVNAIVHDGWHTIVAALV